MKKFLCQFTEELFEVLERMRGKRPRNAIIEEILWRSREVKRAAEENGIEREPRPERGKYERGVK